MAHSIFLKLAASAVALSMMTHPAAVQNAPAAELTQADEMPKTQDIDIATNISLARTNLTTWLAAFNCQRRGRFDGAL